MNHIELWKKQFLLLKKYNLPIPVKAEEVKDKKLLSVLRLGVFKDPLLVFEDNKAVWIRSDFCGDSTYCIDVSKKIDSFGCSSFDIEEYLYKLKNVKYPNALEAYNQAKKLLQRFLLEQRKEQYDKLKKEFEDK